MSHVAKVTRNAAWLIVQRVLMAVLSVAVTAIVARDLGTDQYGVVLLALSYVALFMPLGQLGLRPYGVRLVAADPANARAIVEEMLTLRLGLAAAAMLLAVVFLHFAEPHIPDSVVALLALQFFLFALANCFIDALYGVEDIKGVARTMAISGVATQAACLAAVLSGTGLEGVMAGYAFGVLVMLVVAWRRAGVRLGTLRWRRLRRAHFAHVRESRVFFFQAVVSAIRQRVDLVIVSLLLGTHAAGVYGSALTLIQRLDLVSDGLSTALFPRVADLHGRAGPALGELVSTSFKLVLILSLPMATGLALVADDVIALIFGSRFGESGPVLAVIGLGVPFSYAYGNLFNVLTAMGQQDFIFRWSIVSALATPLAMLAGVHFGGTVGAAAAFVAILASLTVPAVVRAVRDVGPLLGARDALALLAANALMGALVWAASPWPLAARVAVGIAAYGACVLAFRIVKLSTLRTVLGRRTEAP